MTEVPPSNRSVKNGIILLLGFALIKLTLHCIANFTGGYGIFRDELYYIACTNHLDIGYVDQPPFSIYILELNRALLGDSIFALRLLPAIAGAIVVYLTGLMTREMGGRIFAQSVACLASLVSVINIGFDSIYSMNAFDLLFAALSAFLTLKLIRTQNTKYWLLLGTALGLGTLNKIGMLWYGGGIFLGLLISSHRTWFRTRWPWIAGAITFILFLPFVIWNFMHDFAHLEFIRNATAGKYSGLSAWTFTVGQVLMQNPVTLPVWLSGLVFILLLKQGAPYRPLGIAYLFSFLVLIVNGHSKAEYLAPAYAALFAAGGVVIELWLSHRSLLWLRPVYCVLLVAGLLFAPLALPILPVDSYVRYAGLLGQKPSSAESKELSQLPQFYADMFGWEEKAAAVGRAYHRLSPADQSECALFADNYGRCGAIDYYGNRYGLPPSIGNHNSYWIWGPRNYSGKIVIILGGDLERKQQQFESVEVVDSVSAEYCMPYENNLHIYLCRNLKAPLGQLWSQIRHYD